MRTEILQMENWQLLPVCTKEAEGLDIILACDGAASVGQVGQEVAVKLTREVEGARMCCITAIAAESKPHVGIAERARKLIVINGCQNECAKKIAENLGILGISYDAYLNLEYDLGIEKIGPFTTLQYSHDDVERVNESIRNMLRQLRKQK
ncbi:MAG: zinc-binding protein [Candidatus Aminicenantes bacterium]|nr:MAG: zinc-binding protein [Candidatus Aminicenantes bacterium]